MGTRNQSSPIARRWEIGGSVLLLIVVCAGLALYLRQRQLDFALLDAAANQDIQNGLKALAAGANPNARGVAGESGISRLLAILGLPLTQSSQNPSRSALSLADDSRTEELVLALLQRGALPEGHEKYTPAEVEPLLAKYSRQKLEEGSFEEDWYSPPDDARLCHRILARFPDSSRAMLALGEALFRSGNYQEARDQLQQAAAWLPNDARAASISRLADVYLTIKKVIRRCLPRPELPLYLRRFPASARVQPMWIALMQDFNPIPTLMGNSSGGSGLHLVAWKEIGTEMRLCRKVTLMCAGSGSFYAFQLRDLTGDSIPELAVLCGDPGLGETPSYLWIFTVESTRLIQKLALYGGTPPWTKDLDGDGVPEILTRYEIGREPSHLEQPRWVDTYLWKNSLYVDADRDFPKEVLVKAGSIESALKRYPKDWQLWKYRGLAQIALGRRREARTTLRRTLELLVAPHGTVIRD